MSPSTLADLALTQVSERLQGYGSYLEGDARDAISALLKALEAGLTGTLDPGYHLSAIDPGIGKSLSVSTFLRTWKAQGFIPSSSVLVGLSRLAEIDSYLRDAGLEREDVAVLTSDNDLNDLGVPPDQHGSARVMFTSQQMIEKRTRGRKSAEATEFHFEGQPRSLRIWDESLVPSEGLTLRVDDLVRLPGLLRRRSPKLAAEVQGLVSRLWGAGGQVQVIVPDTFQDAASAAKGSKDTALTEVLGNMERLAGRPTMVIDVGGGDLHLAGASAPLPDDFAPVVVLDASGRVRSTYRIWEEEGGNLHRLPHAANDYRNLRINLWERRAGKLAMSEAGVLDEIVKAVAEVIDDDPTSDWLIVSYKDHPVEVSLRKALKNDPGDRLHFLTWGMHHGTNAFRDCKKVVLIGQYAYNEPGYAALAAASGHSGDIQSDEIVHRLKVGEYRHNFLQALTRASARKSKNGIAGTCSAYVIVSPNFGAASLLMETFPGCMIEPWSPAVVLEAKGQAGQLIAFLEATRGDGKQRVTMSEMRAALNVKPPNLTRLLDHPAVVAYRGRMGMIRERTYLAFPTGFGPYAGDFTVDELDDQ